MGLDVLVIGNCTVDLILSVPSFPQPDGAMFMTRSAAPTIGGIAAVAGIAAARLGARVGFAGMVGKDDAGRLVQSSLEEEGIDLSLLIVSETIPTPACVIISDQSAGTRSILADPSIATAYKLPAREDIARAAASARCVHFDYLAFPDLAEYVLPRSRATGTLVSIDAGTDFPGIDRYLPFIDVYATTSRQLRTMSGLDDMKAAMVWLQQRGPRIVVATMGSHGSIGLGTDGRVYYAPAYQVPVVDTTGAGDVFHGGLLYALLQDDDLGTALAFANATAALSCRVVGGGPGCPRLADVQALIRARGYPNQERLSDNHTERVDSTPDPNRTIAGEKHG
jgi:sugar/nucleoside kinase (ribokinase family)